MKLPIPFLSNKKTESAYYLALLLTDEKASAVVLHESDGKIKIINSHEEFFPASVDTISQEELITGIDKAISKAEEVLPPNIETHKTVFGVKENWLDAETKKITKEQLTKLKKVCDSLDLTPIGFMVTTEAISNLLQDEEGAPLSAVLADVGHHQITLTLLRGGKTAETVQGPLTESAAESVDKLLQHFTVAVLPARIVLFNSKITDKISQQFISHQWSKSLPFLHVPQITVLPNGFDAKAVTFGAATQLGFELARDAHNVMPHTLPVHHEKAVHHEAAPKEELEETTKPTHPTPEEEPEEVMPPHHAEAAIPVSGDNFGFVMDKDIASEPPPERKHPVHPTTHAEHPAHHEPVHHQTHQPVHHESAIHHQTHDEPTHAVPHAEGKRKASLLAGLPAFKFPQMPGGATTFAKNKIVWIVVAVLVLLGAIGGGLSYYYVNNVTASVVLTLKPKVANQEADVTFSTTAPSDFSKDVIAAKAVTVSLPGTMTVDATGKKDVGEKAKGKVTIYNSSDDSVSLDEGTTLKSSNGTTFVLDRDVRVASAEGDIFSGTKPGTTDATVTAKDPGTESNLPSNTKFALGGNLLAAKNDDAFSGGSKKTVTVVSKEDLAKLRTELPQTLEDKGLDQLMKQAESGETVLSLLSSTTLEKATFDKKIGDEAKKVKLTATVAFGGMSYTNDDLEQYAKSKLKNDNEKNISFADNSIKNNVSDVKKKTAKEATATIELEAGLLPNIDKTDVMRSVEGKSLQEAKDELAKLPQLEKSEINFSPSIPFLPNIFPKLPKTITVDISANE